MTVYSDVVAPATIFDITYGAQYFGDFSAVAERFLFINPEPGKAMKIVVAFLAYHALKNEPHQLPERAVRAAWDQAVSTAALRQLSRYRRVP